MFGDYQESGDQDHQRHHPPSVSELPSTCSRSLAPGWKVTTLLAEMTASAPVFGFFLVVEVESAESGYLDRLT